jgi:hypothetical protein
MLMCLLLFDFVLSLLFVSSLSSSFMSILMGRSGGIDLAGRVLLGSSPKSPLYGREYINHQITKLAMTPKWKPLLLAALAVLTIGVLISFLASDGRDNPFKVVELDPSNSVLVSGEFPIWYDTVLLLGMSSVGLSDVSVTVDRLSDGARNGFDGDLKAHIRYWGGHFFLFTGEMDREEAIRVFSHEIIHILQYTSGEIVYDGGTDVIWKGRAYPLDLDYSFRPWEEDAFAREGVLRDQLTTALW